LAAARPLATRLYPAESTGPILPLDHRL
jgi:hypothetical protein